MRFKLWFAAFGFRRFEIGGLGFGVVFVVHRPLRLQLLFQVL